MPMTVHGKARRHFKEYCVQIHMSELFQLFNLRTGGASLGQNRAMACPGFFLKFFNAYACEAHPTSSQCLSIYAPS
jgi:hypothetical protein